MNKIDFKNQFLEKRKGSAGGINRALMIYTNSKNDPNYKLFCFVEGSTDAKFYPGVLHKKCNLNYSEILFIFNYSEEDDGFQNIYSCGGKESVIKMCKYLTETSDSKLSKCKFIVDRDYDEIDSQKYDIDDSVIRNITMLPCYSFENYYFLPENMSMLFREIFKSTYFSYLDDFEKILKDFMLKTSSYSALKKIVVELKSIGKEKYSSNNKYIDLEMYLLNIEISGNCISINSSFSNLFNKAKEDFYSYLSKDKKQFFELSFSQYEEELKSDRRDIKGKLLFSLLLKFININSRKSYSKNEMYAFSNMLECEGI